MTDNRAVPVGRRVAFGERLVSIRHSRNLTQQNLADEVGASVRAILGYEKGSTYPRRRRLFKLAAALECSVGWLEGISSTPDPTPLPSRYKHYTAEQLAAAAYKAAQRENLACPRKINPTVPLDPVAQCRLYAYHPGPCKPRQEIAA